MMCGEKNATNMMCGTKCLSKLKSIIDDYNRWKSNLSARWFTTLIVKVTKASKLCYTTHQMWYLLKTCRRCHLSRIMLKSCHIESHGNNLMFTTRWHCKRVQKETTHWTWFLFLWCLKSVQKFQPIFIGSKIINLIHLHRIGRRVKKTADSVQ